MKAIKSFIPVRISTTLKCTCLQSTKDESRIFFGTKEGRIGIVERESEEVMKVEDVSRYAFSCLELDVNDAFVFASGPEGVIRRFNNELLDMIEMTGHTACVNALVVGKDNKKLFSASSDGTVRLWPVEGGESVVLFSHESEIYCLDVTSNIKFVAFGGNAGIITVGEVKYEDEVSFTVVKSIEWNEQIFCLQFSSTNSFLAVGDKKGFINVYHCDSWGIVRKFNHGECVNAVNISLEENLIVTCGKDSLLKVWDMKGKHEEFVLKAHTGPIKGCVITKDQKSIISGGNDGYVIVWRMPIFEVEHRWKIRNFETIDIWYSVTENRLEGYGLGETGSNFVWWDANGNMNQICSPAKSKPAKLHCLSGNEILLFYPFIASEDSELLTKEQDELEEYTVVDVYGMNEKSKLRTHLIESICTRAQVTKDKRFCITSELFRIKLWRLHNFELALIIPGIIGLTRCVCFDYDLSFLAVYDDSGTLNKFKLNNVDNNEISVDGSSNLYFPMKNKIECKLEITRNKKYLLVVFNDQFLVVEIRTFQIVKTYQSTYIGITLSSKDTILLSTGTGIDVYSQEDFSLLACYRKKLLFDKFVVSHDQKEFTFLYKNIFLRQPNPLNSNTLKIFGSKSEELEMVYHVYSVIKKKCNTPYTGLPFLIEPLHINLLHIYAQRNLGELLRQGIESGIPYISSHDGWTPLSVSIRANFNDCVKNIVKGLTNVLNPSTVPTDALTFQKIEQDLIGLNNYGFYNLHKLYDQLLIEEVSNNNPNLCDVSISLPVVYYSDFPFISCEDMGISKEPPELTNAICNKKSLVRFNMEMGSSQSLTFLTSIKNCSNKEIFKTELIQMILDEKWVKARRLMIYQMLVYVCYLISLVLYLSEIEWMIWVTFVLNIMLYSYEAIFIALNPLRYFRSFWNLIDTARAGLLVYYFFSYHNDNQMTGLLSIIVMISWIRGITYFRVNSKTRYLIGLLFQVIVDVIPFMVIFLYTTLGYGIVQGMLTNNVDNPFDNFMGSYLISNGGWQNFRYAEENRNARDFIYPTSIIVITLINPIIVVNLLVAILSDTYENVQEQSTIADGLELVDMIIEIETLFFWNRPVQDKKFLHMAVLNLIQDEDADDMEVQDLVRKVKEKLEAVKLEICEKSRSFQSLMTHNKSFNEQVATGLGSFLEKLG